MSALCFLYVFYIIWGRGKSDKGIKEGGNSAVSRSDECAEGICYGSTGFSWECSSWRLIGRQRGSVMR